MFAKIIKKERKDVNKVTETEQNEAELRKMIVGMVTIEDAAE